MREPTVAEVMTRAVATAVSDTPFREIVSAMIGSGVSALPVIDPAGRPIGVVGEADVLAKLEFHCGADAPPLLASARTRARWHKSSARTAADLMTTPATTISTEAPLRAAVRRLASAQLRQLCVVDRTDRLVGVLAHPDALRLFLHGVPMVSVAGSGGFGLGVDSGDLGGRFEFLAELPVLQGEPLDVGYGHFQVFGERGVVLAELGVLLLQRDALAGVRRHGDVGRRRAPSLAEFSRDIGKDRKVVLVRPNRRANARTLGRLPSAWASAMTWSRAWRACSAVGSSSVRVMAAPGCGVQGRL
jgi:CBS domain-containing protein